MRIPHIIAVCTITVLCIAPLSAQSEKMDKMSKEKMEKMAKKEAMEMKEKGTSPMAKEMIGDVSRTGDKWVKLFEAMPEDKLDWRPSDGVRSVRELFTHIGDANYFFLTFVGVEMPKGGPELPKDQAARENRFKTKAEILAHLKGSFDYTMKNAGALTPDVLNGEVNMFGNKVTGRAAMMTNLGHMHEHLGQAIAYARVNGVTPPWSQGN